MNLILQFFLFIDSEEKRRKKMSFNRISEFSASFANKCFTSNDINLFSIITIMKLVLFNRAMTLWYLTYYSQRCVAVPMRLRYNTRRYTI